MKCQREEHEEAIARGGEIDQLKSSEANERYESRAARTEDQERAETFQAEGSPTLDLVPQFRKLVRIPSGPDW